MKGDFDLIYVCNNADHHETYMFLNTREKREKSMSKVIFVSGGATGIGAASIERLIREGYKVGFIDRDQTNGQKTAGLYSTDKVTFIPGDVSVVSDINRAVQATVAQFGKLNGVFANAGIHQSKTLMDMTEEDWREVIDVNLKGIVFTVKAAVPHLIQSGGGSVVLMGSDQCFIGKSSSCAYGMSKGAIGQFTKSSAIDLAQFKIRVNTVCPATIKTPLSERAIERWANREFQGDIARAWQLDANDHILGRVGTPTEVSNLVHFLLSEESSFMTGGLYPVDGGYIAR